MDKNKPQTKCDSGFINVLKPPGITSAQVVGRVRRLVDGEKVGHAGTLDPEAAGVLPLMVGKAARLFDYMQAKEKAYLTEIAFGCETDTQDAQGQITDAGDRYPDEASLRKVLITFVGEQLQTPPMFSALKHEGKPLYRLARSGETLALEPRTVTVHTLELLRMSPRHGAFLTLTCAKGFYVRTLCQDIGKALGCPAHMRFLLRTQSGVFKLDTASTLEQLQQAKDEGKLAQHMLPMEIAVANLPRLEVPARLEKPFRNGIPLREADLPGFASYPEAQQFQLWLNGVFIAIGEKREGCLRQRTWLGD